MRRLPPPKARAGAHWGVFFLVCATIQLREVNAVRRSARVSRFQQTSQLLSSRFASPAARALAQLAEGRLSETPASVEWRHTHGNYVMEVEVRTRALPTA